MSDVKVVLVGLFLGFCLGNIFQIYVSNEVWELEAVEHGAAEYLLDPDNGDVVWRWK